MISREVNVLLSLRSDMWFDTNETKYSKDGIHQMSKLIHRKPKQDIEWQGWILVIVIVIAAIAVSGLLLVAWARALGVAQ